MQKFFQNGHVRERMRKCFLMTAFWVFLWGNCSVSFAARAGNVVCFPDRKAFLAKCEKSRVDARGLFEYDDQAYGIVVDLDQQCAGISYGLTDNACVDLRVGEAKVDIYGPESPDDPGIRFGWGSFWGIGIRSKINLDRGFLFGVGFQYNRYHPGVAYRSGMEFESEPWEWHLSFDVNKEIKGGLGLYAGIRYSDIKIPYSHPSHFGTRKGGFEAEDNVGIFAGVEANLGKKMTCFVEGHLFDEKAVAFGVGYSF